VALLPAMAAAGLWLRSGEGGQVSLVPRRVLWICRRDESGQVPLLVRRSLQICRCHLAVAMIAAKASLAPRRPLRWSGCGRDEGRLRHIRPRPSGR
jgi:hypothetical protein